jgi:hypothetical protein
MEFLEEAAGTFGGFKNDINSILVDEDIAEMIIDIAQYYRESDILN